MKTSFCIFTVILGSLFLTGCDNPKSTQWYKEHPDELSQRYKACVSSGDDSRIAKMHEKRDLNSVRKMPRFPI